MYNLIYNTSLRECANVIAFLVNICTLSKIIDPYIAVSKKMTQPTSSWHVKTRNAILLWFGLPPNPTDGVYCRLEIWINNEIVSKSLLRLYNELNNAPACQIYNTIQYSSVNKIDYGNETWKLLESFIKHSNEVRDKQKQCLCQALVYSILLKLKLIL